MIVRMRLGVLIAAVSSVVVTIPFATAVQQPKFEEASVKRTESCLMKNSVDPGMIALHGDPLIVVIMEAFKVKMDQIKGPSWLGSDCFTINAKMPPGATKDQLPAMLQSLLSERFRLAFHKESGLRSGYALLLDKSQPKFKEADTSSPSSIAHKGQFTFGSGPNAGQIKGAMTMALLCRFVSTRLGVPVQDLTGLQGKYDIDVSWAADRTLEKLGQPTQGDYTAHTDSAEPTADPPAGPNIFTAFRNSLGLRLESRKAPAEVIVIDHIEQRPSDN
jgi:uncharacterized protein (TIGR03435 family)